MRALSAKIIRILSLIEEQPRSGVELGRIAPECFTLKQDEAGLYVPSAPDIYMLLGRIRRRGLIRQDLNHTDKYAETWQARKCSKYYRLTAQGIESLNESRKVLADTSFKAPKILKKRGRPPKATNIITTNRQRKRNWNAKRA